MIEPDWQRLGPWRFRIAPGRNFPGLPDAIANLPSLLESAAAPLVPPGRHRIDRISIPLGNSPPLDAVVKTYGLQSAWRDRIAAARGSKAERAFHAALALHSAGVGTPAPVAVVERWNGPRLAESRFISDFVPNLSNLRDELDRIYSSAPFCEPLMELLRCVALAVRRFHDAGLLHRDLGNQNVALRPSPGPDPWQVLFLDLNRARHVPNPSPALRGADLARIDLPSDFRRVFHAMYFDGHPPPPDFAGAESRARAAFDRHTALRPFRHPLREARIRRAKPSAPLPPRGRDLWIWDDRSAQPIPAYSSRDRRKLLPAANAASSLLGLARHSLLLRREYLRLSAASFQSPVPFDQAVGMALDPNPSTWRLQLDHLALLQGPRRLPILLRLCHHLGPDSWLWTLEQAAALARNGHPVALALVQDRRAVLDPRGWDHMVSLAFDRAAPFADFFEIGHAVNRSKWGVWDFREYLRLLEPVRAGLALRPGLKIVAPACIDFEPHALAGLLRILPADLPFHALSDHLYVDRRGAPENPQGPFDLVGKCALLRAFARTRPFADDRLLVTETNWPLAGTGPWSPVTSPYETLGPRKNDPSVSEDAYAAFMARYLLLAIASGHVSRVYWWRLAARGFGLVDDSDPAAWRPRPAFHALQRLLHSLDGASFARKLDSPPGEFALEFSRPASSPVVARWSLSSSPSFE